MLNKKRWIVLIAAIFLNLGIGIIYSWSIIKEAIDTSIKLNAPDSFKWDVSSLNDPYSVSVLMFAFTMIFSGRMQDKIGPRITIYIGGVLISVGALIAALSTSYVIWILGFGVLIGGGIGFCYSAITPVTIKWFSPDKTGLVTGVVVAGFGLSSVYLAPLFTTLIRSFALQGAMIY